MKPKYAVIIILFLFSLIKESLNDSIDLVIKNQDELTHFKSLAILTFQKDTIINEDGSFPQAGNDEGDDPMTYIRLVEVVALICPDRFLYVNRFVGKPGADDKYFNVTINPRALENVGAVNLWLQMSTNVTIGLDPNVAMVKHLGGNTYLIQSRGRISSLKFGIHGTLGEPFPLIQWINFNGRSVCVNMRKWNPQESDPVPQAASSALIPPTKFIPECGRKRIDYTPLVINGDRTKPGDWPWHVAMFVRATEDESWSYQCGGTVVSRKAVLSACHCVVSGAKYISRDNMILIMGKYNLYKNDEHSTNYTVESIVPHPEYNFDTLRNDFAVIFTTKEIVFNDFVQPICLWDQRQVDKNILYGEFGSVVGWGTNEEDELSEQLTTGRMRVVPDANCLQSLPNFFSRFLNPDSFCAGNGPDNLTSACNGDSGGSFAFPITMADGRVTWFLRGVISLSVARTQTRICDPRQHILIADAASQADWIYDQTGIQPYNDTWPERVDPYARVPNRKISTILMDLAQELTDRANERNSFD